MKAQDNGQREQEQEGRGRGFVVQDMTSSHTKVLANERPGDE
jgi:hypothetical protein